MGRAAGAVQVAHQLITGNHQAAAENAAAMCLRGGSSAVYDIGNELLDPATLAQAILTDKPAELLG